MDHHIITTDARYWTTDTTDASIIENHSECEDQINVSGIALRGDSGEEMNGGCSKQKSRRSQTEAERGMKAHPNALRPATTKAGKHRIRMKWSNDVNEFIMRTYYTITSLETQTKSYRDSLHKLFARQYPDVSISQQRIADQRRAIVKNNLLPRALLESIREEVAISLQMKPFTKTQPQPAETTATTIIKQDLGPTHIVSNPMMKVVHHHQVVQQPQPHQVQQQPQQQQQVHHHHHLQPTNSSSSTPIHIHTSTTHLQQTTPQQQRIHHAAALQNQPHIIIRVNSTANGALKHHFVDDGSTI